MTRTGWPSSPGSASAESLLTGRGWLGRCCRLLAEGEDAGPVRREPCRYLRPGRELRRPCPGQVGRELVVPGIDLHPRDGSEKDVRDDLPDERPGRAAAVGALQLQD